MWSHTRSLEALVLVATIAPAELVRVATSFSRPRSGPFAGTVARRALFGVPTSYLAVAVLATAVATSGGYTPAYVTMWRTSPPWLVVAAGAGCTLVGAEFAIGAATKLLRGVRGWRLAMVVTGAPSAATARAYAISLAGTAVAEEVLYRGLWIGILQQRLMAPAWVAVGCAALAYALGHLFFGMVAVAQKVAAGWVFGVLLVVSGSLAVPLVAHLSQNLVVLLLGLRQEHAR